MTRSDPRILPPARSPSMVEHPLFRETLLKPLEQNFIGYILVGTRPFNALVAELFTPTRHVKSADFAIDCHKNERAALAAARLLSVQCDF